MDQPRRGAGDRIPELIELALGVSFWDAVISLALGENPHLTPVRARGACIRFLTCTTGVIRDITGVDRARLIPGVVDIASGAISIGWAK